MITLKFLGLDASLNACSKSIIENFLLINFAKKELCSSMIPIACLCCFGEDPWDPVTMTSS